MTLSLRMPILAFFPSFVAWHLGAISISPLITVQFSHRLTQAATIARAFVGKKIAPKKLYIVLMGIITHTFSPFSLSFQA